MSTQEQNHPAQDSEPNSQRPMPNAYYKVHPRGFSNEYTVYVVEQGSPEEEYLEDQGSPDDHWLKAPHRITRKEAIKHGIRAPRKHKRAKRRGDHVDELHGGFCMPWREHHLDGKTDAEIIALAKEGTRNHIERAKQAAKEEAEQEELARQAYNA